MNALTRTEIAAAAAAAVLGRDRSKFLGGSDAAAVMGLSPWKTPVELWQEKTGRATKDDEADQQRQRMFARGHKLEPFIRDMTIEKLQDLGLRVELVAVNRLYSDPEHPFLSCEVDFELRLWGEMEINDRTFLFGGEHVNADAKSVSGFARKKWGLENTEDVPIEYAAQFMHGLGVTGRRFCLVAALRSFDDVDIYWTIRDDETIAAMRAKEVQFWVEHVLADVPPDPLTFSDIKLLFPTDNGEKIEATPEIAQKVTDLRRIRAATKDLEEQDEVIAFEIGEFMSPHSILTYQGRDIATWKRQGTTRLDQKALKEKAPEIHEQFCHTTYGRVMRLKSPK